MLSAKTKEFLDEVCDYSDAQYKEGGALYVYKYGRNQAHVLLSEYPELEASWEQRTSELTGADIISFGRVIMGAKCLLTERDESSPEKIRQHSEELLCLLKSDLNYDRIAIAQLDLSGISDSIELVLTSGNNFSSLLFFWSID
jgi:hypothetical protein